MTDLEHKNAIAAAVRALNAACSDANRKGLHVSLSMVPPHDGAGPGVQYEVVRVVGIGGAGED